VIEIASNDGYLLQFYKQAGVPALGIEPASNVAARALARGIPTVCDFFSFELAQSLRSEGKKADVIHANNVLGHVADIDGFFRALASLLKNDGVIVIEVPYVRDMIERTEFDTVYHEHLSYFSLAALDRSCLQHGLVITNVERLAIHGGSLRVFAEHGSAGKQAEPIVSRMLAEEASCGLTTFPFYIGFSTHVACLKSRLLGRLTNLKSQGARIAVYGASAKGATLLNHFGIDAALVDFVVDRNPSKQGLYTPGAHLPVYPAHKLLEEMPEYVLLLTWNFAEEIIEQQAEYRRRGGRFIVPIPDLRVI
jgi:SAM-dependent methyltransferase